jgi:hypothetical protein
MPELRISDPAFLPFLLEDLRARMDVVAEVIDDDAIEVTILGSYGQEGMRLALYLRVRAWEAAQRARGIDVRVEVVE